MIEVLKNIGGGAGTTSSLMRVLGLDEKSLNSILGLLLSEGLVDEVFFECHSCDNCPFRESCDPGLRSDLRRVRVYVLTGKARKLLSETEW